MKQRSPITGPMAENVPNHQEENKPKGINGRLLRRSSSQDFGRRGRRLSRKVLSGNSVYVQINERKISENTKEDKKSNEGKKKKDLSDECEFAVAADLTLYANPLRILKKTAKPPLQHAGSETEMIAADLVKYGSPLDK